MFRKVMFHLVVGLWAQAAFAVIVVHYRLWAGDLELAASVEMLILFIWAVWTFTPLVYRDDPNRELYR